MTMTVSVKIFQQTFLLSIMHCNFLLLCTCEVAKILGLVSLFCCSLLIVHVLEEVTTWNKGQTITVTCPPAKTSAADAPQKENLSRERKCEAKEDRELTTPLPEIVHVGKSWRCSWSNWMLYIDGCRTTLNMMYALHKRASAAGRELKKLVTDE